MILIFSVSFRNRSDGVTSKNSVLIFTITYGSIFAVSEIRSGIQSFSLFLPLISIDRSILIYDAEKGRLPFERKTFAEVFLRRRPR